MAVMHNLELLKKEGARLGIFELAFNAAGTKLTFKLADGTVKEVATGDNTDTLIAQVQAALTAEINRATSAEGNLANLTVSATNLVDAVNAVKALIDGEVASRQSDKTEVLAAVSAETTRAQAAEADLGNAISDESARVDANFLSKTSTVDQAVESNVTFNKDMVVKGNLVVEGSKTEINTVELTVEDNKITLAKGQVGAPAVNAGLEVDRGDGGTQTIFEWSEAGDASVVKVPEFNGTTFELKQVATREWVNANAGALTQAVSDSLAQEVADRQAADSALQTAVTSETTRAQAAEADLQTQVTAEVARATSAESGLQTSIDDEVARATGAEATLQAAIDAEGVTRNTRDQAIVSAVNAAIVEIASKSGFATTKSFVADTELTIANTTGTADVVISIYDESGTELTAQLGLDIKIVKSTTEIKITSAIDMTARVVVVAPISAVAPVVLAS